MKPMIFGIAAELIEKGQAVAAVHTEHGTVFRPARKNDVSVSLTGIVKHEVWLLDRLVKMEQLLLDICNDRSCSDIIRTKVRAAMTPVKTGTSVCAHGTPTDQRCILC